MNHSENVIEVEAVDKAFIIPHERYNSLKQTALNIFKNKGATSYQALKNISFQVKKGEFFGIVGRNGSGKSTLLKIIAEIYSPDKGNVKVSGRIAPFIELGVGFNPELSGRDNIFLNGALLGMSRKQVAAKFNDIVAFSELEEFIDQKLKNYSSGMQVRLAFSIGLQAESDILLIDEVLAVGDIGFQRKCFEVFNQYKENPEKTVVFVTHDMSVAEKFCDRVAVIDESRMLHCGSTSKAVELYYHINSLSEEKRQTDKLSPKGVLVSKVAIQNSSGRTKYLFDRGDSLSIEVLFSDTQQSISGIGVALFKDDGAYCFGTNTFIDKFEVKAPVKQIVYRLPKLPLLPGKYYVNVGVFGRNEMDVKEMLEKATEFRVEGATRYHGVIELEHSWSQK